MPCAVLSAAPAAATCVCRTQLCTNMYCVLKYSLCLASLVYGCVSHAAHYLATLTLVCILPFPVGLADKESLVSMYFIESEAFEVISKCNTGEGGIKNLNAPYDQFCFFGIIIIKQKYNIENYAFLRS